MAVLPSGRCGGSRVSVPRTERLTVDERALNSSNSGRPNDTTIWLHLGKSETPSRVRPHGSHGALEASTMAGSLRIHSPSPRMPRHHIPNSKNVPSAAIAAMCPAWQGGAQENRDAQSREAGENTAPSANQMAGIRRLGEREETAIQPARASEREPAFRGSLRRSRYLGRDQDREGAKPYTAGPPPGRVDSRRGQVDQRQDRSGDVETPALGGSIPCTWWIRS